MFGGISYLFNVLNVEERGDRVHIQGVGVDKLMADITSVWKTSSAANYMFNNKGRYSFTFHKFFLPDFYHTLTLIEEYKHRRTKLSEITRLKKAVIENTWFKTSIEEGKDVLDFTRLNELTWKPLDHQFAQMDHFNATVQRMNLRGMLVAAKPGSGKTFMGLATSTCAKTRADINIWVVPKKAVDTVWETTIRDVFKVPQSVWTSLSGKPIASGYKHYIAHYEQIDVLLEHFKKNDRNKTVFIGVDECHAFNEIRSQRTQLIEQLHKAVNLTYTLWMSGTPFKALGTEVIPFLRCADPLFDKTAEAQFINVYGKSSLRALSILSHRITLISYKVPDSVTIAKEPNYSTIEVEMPGSDKYTLPAVKEAMMAYINERLEYYRSNMKVIKQIYDECIEFYERTIVTKEDREAFKTYKNYFEQIRKYGYDPKTMQHMLIYCKKIEETKIMPVLPKDLRDLFKKYRSVVRMLEQVVAGEALGNVLGKLRNECFAAMVPYIPLDDIIRNAEKKTILFTSSVGVVDQAASILERKGYRPLKVYGDTNKNLKSIVDTFFNDKSANPLIATYQSLSEAVPLIVANTIVMLNQPFRDYIRTQTIARIARLGQDAETYVIDVVLKTPGEDNLSTRSKDIMEWSRQQVAAILGEPVDETMDAVIKYALTGDPKSKGVVQGLMGQISKLFKK